MQRTVLVVDDSATIRQVLTYTLEQAGYAVVQATDGQDGVEKLCSTRPDLIITDLNMPRLDGIGFIRKVRSEPATKYTPVLMLTTESHDGRKQEGRAAGATGWIVKPFVPDKLLLVVRKLLP